MLFNEKLARFHVRADSARQAICLGSRMLLEAGDVKGEFERHVLEREVLFPTGLDVQPVGVAIPHTDSIYVNHSQMAFVSLRRPVEFRYMADKDRIVRVGMVFVLAMAHSHEQVDTLSALMGLFAREETVSELYECASSVELTALLQRNGIS